MSIMTLILGEPGTGKTTSLRNLPPEQTFIVSVTGKPFPIRNFRKSYPELTKDNPRGRYFKSNDWAQIVRIINGISQKRPEIKYLVLDDFQYLLSDEFFGRADEKGFTKFAEIGAHAWSVLGAMENARTNLHCIVLAHTELDAMGRYKIKTIGKMFDDKASPEGRFPQVFHAKMVNEQYKFLTNHDGTHVARTPLEMFSERYIDNDMMTIVEKIDAFYGDDLAEGNV